MEFNQTVAVEVFECLRNVAAKSGVSLSKLHYYVGMGAEVKQATCPKEFLRAAARRLFNAAIEGNVSRDKVMYYINRYTGYDEHDISTALGV